MSEQAEEQADYEGGEGHEEEGREEEYLEEGMEGDGDGADDVS